MEKPLSVPLELAELQAAVSAATGDTIRLRDPAWLAHFHLHHRQATHYRRGRAFLAGDAGHIHSPVGGQGMNTGIQDAWNLGWKLALVAQGQTTGHAARFVRSGALAGGTHAAALYRPHLQPAGAFALDWRFHVMAAAQRGRACPSRSSAHEAVPRLRLPVFVSELNIRYRRSPLVLEGKPKLRAGPKAGDRLPDARVEPSG